MFPYNHDDVKERQGSLSRAYVWSIMNTIKDTCTSILCVAIVLQSDSAHFMCEWYFMV